MNMKGLAVLIGTKSKIPKAPSKPYESEPDGDEVESDEEESKGPEEGYGTILARVAGIADEDKEDFISALKGFVRSIVRKSDD